MRYPSAVTKDEMKRSKVAEYARGGGGVRLDADLTNSGLFSRINREFNRSLSDVFADTRTPHSFLISPPLCTSCMMEEPRSPLENGGGMRILYAASMSKNLGSPKTIRRGYISASRSIPSSRFTYSSIPNANNNGYSVSQLQPSSSG